MTANVGDKEEEMFLCGRRTLTKWKIVLFFEENRLLFTETTKNACARKMMLADGSTAMKSRGTCIKFSAVN